MWKKILNYIKPQGNLALQHYLDSGSQGYHDTDLLFYTWFKFSPCIHYCEDTILNKFLLENLKQVYPEMEFLYSFINGAATDFTIAEHQRRFFLIRLKDGLLLEYDSMKVYKIYYLKKLEETELKRLLKIMMKSKMEGWIKSYQVSLN